MVNIKTLYKNTDFEPLVVLEKILDFAYKSDSFETGNLHMTVSKGEYGIEISAFENENDAVCGSAYI